MRKQHISLDIREGAVYWARSTPSRQGLVLRSWGVYQPEQRLRIDALLEDAQKELGTRDSRIELAMRSPDIAHRRLDLALSSRRERRLVGRRRAGLLADEQPDEQASSWLWSPSRGGPLWLCSASERLVTAQRDRWLRYGLTPHRISSHQFALGNLVRLVETPGQGELVAIFDTDADSGTCVVADAHGWIFGRLIPLKFAGEERFRESAEEEDSEASEALVQVDRIRTEVERTIRYVQSTLGLGQVTRILVSGESAHNAELCTALGEGLGVVAQPLDAAVATGPAAGADPRAAVALGLALSPSTEGLNLLPRDTLEARAQRRIRSRLTAGLVASSAACAIGGLVVMDSLDDLQIQTSALESNWNASAEARAERAAANRLRQNIEELASGLQQLRPPEPPWTAMLQVLGHLMPELAAIEELSVQREAGAWNLALTLRFGEAEIAYAASAAAEFARQMDATALFKVDSVEATAGSATSAADAPSQLRFRIEARAAEQIIETGVAL